MLFSAFIPINNDFRVMGETRTLFCFKLVTVITKFDFQVIFNWDMHDFLSFSLAM